ADVVWHGEVVAHRVKLSDGQRIEELEVPAAIPALRNATVITDDNVLGIVRIDPHGVVIDVNAVSRGAGGLAAVVGEKNWRGRPIDSIRVLGIDAHLRVVEGTRVLIVGALPGRAGVLRAIE